MPATIGVKFGLRGGEVINKPQKIPINSELCWKLKKKEVMLDELGDLDEKLCWQQEVGGLKKIETLILNMKLLSIEINFLFK